MSAQHRDDPAADLTWYAQWFGEEYLQLYPHRDEEEARSAVELVLRHFALASDAHILDLACGQGRHLREFATLGFRAIGLDLSPYLLDLARETGMPLVRGDMRMLPFASRSCDLVTNFFTSFGYFADPDDDRLVLSEVSRVLRHDAVFAFDFLNADRVRASLPSRDVSSVDGRLVRQVRGLVDDGRTVEKRIEILGPTDPIPHIYYERVRLYSSFELSRMLADSGLQVVESFGSYAGDPPSSSAPRVILIGRAL
jgi:SAM-dependent methyltransferase